MLSPARTALGQTDPCSLIPTQYIPGIRDIVTRLGCNPATRAAASALIAEQFAGSPYANVAATLGPALIVDCICKGQPGYQMAPSPYPYIPPAQPWYSNPLVLGGLVIGGVLLAVLLSRPRETSAAPTPAR